TPRSGNAAPKTASATPSGVQPPTGRAARAGRSFGDLLPRTLRGPGRSGSARGSTASSIGAGDPDQILGGRGEGATVRATEDLVDREAGGFDQPKHLVRVAEVDLQQAVAAFEDESIVVEDLGDPSLGGDLTDRVEVGVLPERHPLAGLGVADLTGEAVVVL